MLCMSRLTRVGKAKAGVGFYFIYQGAVFGNWAASIPSIQDQNEISNAVLGGILVAAVAGAMLALPIVTHVNKIYGSGNSLAIGSIVLLCLFPLVGLKGPIGLFIGSVCFLGFGAGWTDVSANVQAVLVEKMSRSPSIGFFHALYAAGGIVGALLGGLLLQYGFSPFEELSIFSVTCFLPAILFKYWGFSRQEENLINNGSVAVPSQDDPFYPNDHKYEPLINPISFIPEFDNNSTVGSSREDHNSVQSDFHDSQSSRQSDWQVYEGSAVALNHTLGHKEDTDVDYGTLAIVSMMCFIAYFGEGSIGDWSAIFLQDNMGSSVFIGSLGFVSFQVSVMFGRYYSDIIVLYIRRRTLLKVAGIVGAFGLACVSMAPYFDNKHMSLVMSIIGFAICGAGVSTIAPSVISMVGQGVVSGMEINEAIAYVSSIGYLGVMIGPPMLGAISFLLGSLRWSFACDAAVVFGVAILAYLLRSDVDVLMKHQISEDNIIQ